jgi:chromate reductase
VTIDAPRVLAIVGSLRRESYSGAILRALQEAVGARARLEVGSIASIPLYNADLDGEDKPEPVVALKTAIRDCDGLLIVSPEYNYGTPGVLKNALDWASRPGYQSVLKGKPVLVVTSSPGMSGGARAQGQLRQTFAGTLSRIVAVPEVLVPQVHTKVQEGRFTDAASLKIVVDAFDALLAEVRKQHAQVI